MSILSAGTSNTTSLIYTGDTTGAMVFQTNGTTEAMRITAGQNIGIGITSPSYKVDVSGALRVTNSSGSTIIANRSSNPGSLEIQHSGTQTAQLSAVSGGGLEFYQGSTPTLVMKYDSAGRVTMPSQPVFIATVPTAIDLTYNTTHNISQYYTGIDINRGNHYNTSNGRFTAPVTGLYSFNWKYYLYPIASTEAYLYVNNNSWIRYQMIFNYSSNTNPGGNQGNAVLYLNAGDYVTLHMNFNTVGGSNASLWNGGPRSSHWSGYLVG